MGYGSYKDLAKRTESDRLLRDKPFEIASNPKYDGDQCRLASMIYKFFDKKSAGYKNSASGINNENQQLVNELHKPIITKFKRRKFCSSFKGDI